MCGLFGFIGTQMDIGLVNAIAELAETRGPHAYGFAWVERDAPLQVHKAPGRLTRRKTDLLKLLNATAFIGHCRLSTSGSYANNANNQPLHLGDIALAHNGNVLAFQQLYDLHGYEPKTTNDSEAFLLSIFCAFGPLPARVDEGWQAIGKDTPQAALVLGPGGLAALRRYHPLYIKTTATGAYFCSRQIDDTTTLLTEGVIHHFQEEHYG